MTLHTCSECVFEVDSDWIDDTGYVYEHGDVRVVTGPFCLLATWPGKLDKAAEHFRLAVPDYELVERRVVDRPVPGAELFAHRVGGSIGRFEVSVFWPLGETIWVFRARAPLASEDLCWRATESFLETYEPTEPMEALNG